MSSILSSIMQRVNRWDVLQSSSKLGLSYPKYKIVFCDGWHIIAAINEVSGAIQSIKKIAIVRLNDRSSNKYALFYSQRSYESLAFKVCLYHI